MGKTNRESIDEMVTTDDKKMVLVEYLTPVYKNSRNWVDAEKALMGEAQGLWRIIKRGESAATQIHGESDKRPDVVLTSSDVYGVTSGGRVQVEYTERALINSYGKFGDYLPKDAEVGEKLGKWKIVNPKEVSADNRAQGIESYLPRENLFGRQEFETKGIKKKRAAWIQDSFIVGGAELSNQLVIKVGVDCGWIIDLVTPVTDLQVMRMVLAQSDIIIVNNIWGFQGEIMRVLLNAIYSDEKSYIKYEHDHRELNRPDFSRRLFQNSEFNVFLSPIHFKNHQEVLGCGGIVLPLAIDVNMFKPVAAIKRNENTAVVCNVRNFKLWTKLQKYIDDHPEIRFTVMAGDSVVRGANVMGRDKIPYEKMPELYSGFEYVVHILDGWGAGERVIFEGALCGCRVIANERVGHMSWGKDLTDVDGLRKWLVQAPYQFWRAVEERL